MTHQLLTADARAIPLRDASVQCVVTSPPYWGLRDYSVPNSIGLEDELEIYVFNLVQVFRELKRVLKDDGTAWLNLGDAYAGGNYRGGGVSKASAKQASNTGSTDFMGKKAPPIPNGVKRKDLIGLPWRIAFALQADGWYIRNEIIWAKRNPMPESIRDRLTKSHETVFLLTKNERYFFDQQAIKEPAGEAGKTVKDSRNKRDVWWLASEPFPQAHFATFPTKLVEPCVLAGSREDDVVLDPFSGAGTTGVVCQRLGRHYIGVDLKHEYSQLARSRFPTSKESRGEERIT